MTEERPQHLERREQLLAVAKKIFAERGFQSTTMDDIAKEAGFTKPILYQFFQSKTELYKEIVAQIAQSMIHSLSKAVNSVEAPRAKIEVAFRVYFDMAKPQVNCESLKLGLSHSWFPTLISQSATTTVASLLLACLVLLKALQLSGSCSKKLRAGQLSLLMKQSAWHHAVPPSHGVDYVQCNRTS